MHLRLATIWARYSQIERGDRILVAAAEGKLGVLPDLMAVLITPATPQGHASQTSNDRVINTLPAVLCPGATFCSTGDPWRVPSMFSPTSV